MVKWIYVIPYSIHIDVIINMNRRLSIYMKYHMRYYYSPTILLRSLGCPFLSSFAWIYYYHNIFHIHKVFWLSALVPFDLLTLCIPLLYGNKNIIINMNIIYKYIPYTNCASSSSFHVLLLSWLLFVYRFFCSCLMLNIQWNDSWIWFLPLAANWNHVE